MLVSDGDTYKQENATEAKHIEKDFRITVLDGHKKNQMVKERQTHEQKW